MAAREDRTSFFVEALTNRGSEDLFEGEDDDMNLETVGVEYATAKTVWRRSWMYYDQWKSRSRKKGVGK